jgi:hypothetical protein
MKLKSIIAGVMIESGGIGIGMLTTGTAQGIEQCVDRAPNAFKGRVGFELIDFARREVWATKDFSPDEFDDLSLPLNMTHWFKNDPRVPLFSSASFLNSPGCEVGEFTYMKAFDRNFVHVVEINSFTRIGSKDARIRRVELEEYHALTFEAGQIVRLLHSPDGQTFIAVAETLNRSQKTFAFPDGWFVKDHTLTDDLEVNLFGTISVIRTANEDSFQGPVRIDIAS